MGNFYKKLTFSLNICIPLIFLWYVVHPGQGRQTGLQKWAKHGWQGWWPRPQSPKPVQIFRRTIDLTEELSTWQNGHHTLSQISNWYIFFHNPSWQIQRLIVKHFCWFFSNFGVTCSMVTVLGHWLVTPKGFNGLEWWPKRQFSG